MKPPRQPKAPRNKYQFSPQIHNRYDARQPLLQPYCGTYGPVCRAIQGPESMGSASLPSAAPIPEDDEAGIPGRFRGDASSPGPLRSCISILCPDRSPEDSASAESRESKRSFAASSSASPLLGRRSAGLPRSCISVSSEAGCISMSARAGALSSVCIS